MKHILGANDTKWEETKIEQLGLPQIEIKYAGPALADEVFDDSMEIRQTINELIIQLESIKSELRKNV